MAPIINRTINAALIGWNTAFAVRDFSAHHLFWGGVSVAWAAFWVLWGVRDEMKVVLNG